MKKRFSDEQIVGFLHEVESGEKWWWQIKGEAKKGVRYPY
jgi:hypothetical protein